MASAIPNSVFFLTSAPRECPKLSEREREYVAQLISINPAKKIITDKSTEKKCKELGQKIFDEFKDKAAGNSRAGEVAVKNVCNAIHFEGSDGRIRKQYVERAWDGIGDSNWQWRA
jgi:mRNA-degrading endonuclease RelE of RelBE toxin-antitoxin system